MLDNIRRKLSQHKHKVFYDKVWNLGIFEDLVYYNDVGYPLPIVRAMKKVSDKSFRYIYQTSQSVKLKGVSFKMIECPKGTFIMGHADQNNNQPRSEMIDMPFLLGQTEVTQELYQVVMGTNPSDFKNSPQNPVEKVSWEDAILFCNKLSELQGLDKCYTKNSSQEYDWLCDFKKNGYRLPREKEWEYAAKAGTQNQWAGTDNADELGEYAVYGNSRKSTQPVGSKAPNEWGFRDMSGNVFEWCWDKYDPTDNTSASRVFRGGGWSYNASFLRSALRYCSSPGFRRSHLGFRVCRSIVN